MTQWLDLVANTISPNPQDWDETPTPDSHYIIVSDGNDGTALVCTEPDRSQKDTLGFPLPPSTPQKLSVLTAVRIKGRFQTVAVIGGVPDPTLYGRIYRSDTMVQLGELSLVQPQTFVPIDFDLGTLSGLSVNRNDVFRIRVELSVLSSGASSGQIVMLISEVRFDYTGVAAATRGNKYQPDATPGGLAQFD